MRELSKGKEGRPFIAMKATNFGPGEVTLTSANGLPSERLFQKKKTALLFNPLVSPFDQDVTQGPFTGLPKKLAVGEEHTSYLALTVPLASSDLKLAKLGFDDTFRRSHWVSTKNLRHFKSQLKKTQVDMGLDPDEPVPRP